MPRFCRDLFGPRVTAKFTGDYCGGSDLHVETQPVDPDTGHPSSQLTVLARDGFDPFRGPVLDAEGRLRVAGNSGLKPFEVLNMEWLCDFIRVI